jgi:aspartate-semialdehyde dehydrogenase
MMKVLVEQAFPITEFYPVASENSVGKEVVFNGKSYPVIGMQTAVDLNLDLAIFSAGGETSLAWAPKFAAVGTVVIDNSSCWRYDQDVPLIVPEVNAPAIRGYTKKNIIANPNCSTIQMLVALKPIHDKVGITRINVATYQAVSGTGKEAIEELAAQTAALLNGRDVETKVYPKQIAFNVLPQIDVFLDNGYTKEEMKMSWETKKIMDQSIEVNATCVRVPVFYGHSEAVHFETRTPISVEDIRALLSKAPGVVLIDERVAGGYPTPVTDSAGKDAVAVGRIRKDISHPNGIDMWIVGDNVRKGAATNSIQIAELLIKEYL